jgi:hypothetical protein
MRPLGAVPWDHNGYLRLSVRGGSDVSPSDASMLRSVLARSAVTCQRVEELDRALNRQLWLLGYVARIATSPADQSTVIVEIESSH